MRYPNLYEVINHHPYHISTFADFADVTTELLVSAIKGEEELTDHELFKISKYVKIPVGVLKCPHMIMLDRNNRHHAKMTRELQDGLYAIWEEQKSGSHEAELFMKYRRTDLVNYLLAFTDNRGTYGWYLGVKKKVDQAFASIENEKRTSRKRNIA